MKKIQLLGTALLLAALTFTFAACGTEPENPGTSVGTAETAALTAAPVPSALAARLAAECTFDEALEQNDAYLSAELPQFTSMLTESYAYVPAGIVPDCVYVFAADTEENAKAIADGLVSYRDTLTEDYAGYAADQVSKLENAVIRTVGNITVYVVSPDADGASALVDSLLK